MAHEYWLALRPDGFKGSGTAIDPYDASSPALFNSLMLKFATDNPSGRVCVHIGPGIFQVPARLAGIGLWTPGPHWRIVGAGKYATTLKVVNVPNDVVGVHPAIGGDVWYQYSEGFTLEDITIDCNIRAFKDLTCATGAIAVGGARTKIRRVRIIDFGTQTQANECFPLFTAGGDPRLPEPRNCEITDCIAERPSPNNTRETSVLAFSAGEFDDSGNVASGQRSIRGVMGYHRSCALRKNMVDSYYSVNQRQIKAITYVGTGATAATFQPHGRKVGDWVIISGALVADSLVNPFNGSFQVTSVSNPWMFSYNMPSEPAAEPTGTIWLGRFPCHVIDIQTISKQGGSGSWIITVTTSTPHFRTPGQNVVIINVRNETDPLVLSPLNGPHRVVDVQSPSIFRFALSVDPQDFSSNEAFIGTGQQGLTADGGTGAVVERNRVFGAIFAGPYHDTWHSKDIIVQKNYYYDVLAGIYQNMGGVSSAHDPTFPRYASGLTRGGSDNRTATLTAPFMHGLLAGQLVQVRNAFVTIPFNPPTNINSFNGFFFVDQVLTPYRFTYRMQADPGANADTTPATNQPVFGAVWQVGRMVCHGNIIELVSKNPYPSGRTFAIGMGANLTTPLPVFIFSELLIRRNFCRPADGATDLVASAVAASWFKNALVQKTVMSGLAIDPLGYYKIGTLKQLNNQTHGGRLVQARQHFFDTGAPAIDLNELQTQFDLSLTVSDQI